MHTQLDQLRSVPMLAECSEAQLKQMLERSSIVAYGANEVIHNAEGSLEFYYILLTGRWRIIRGLPSSSQPLEVERDPQVLGLAAWSS